MHEHDFSTAGPRGWGFHWYGRTGFVACGTQLLVEMLECRPLFPGGDWDYGRHRRGR